MYFADSEDIHTYRWIQYFANRNHEIYLLSFKDSKKFENYENVNVYNLKKAPVRGSSFNKIGIYFTQSMNLGSVVFNPVSTYSYIKRLISEINPEIIHGHSVVHHTILAALTNFHPFVISAWGNDILIYPKKSRIVKYAVKFSLKKADLITSDGVNSNEEIEKMGVTRDKVSLISHGVDTNNFSPIYKDNNLREQLGIYDAPAIISTRRMSSIHDVETLIKAVPIVLKEIPNAVFIVIGDGEQKHNLVNLAESLNVKNNIRFIGSVTHTELPKFLASSEIYVSTSISDGGIAVSTLEAMSCGVPPIITNVGDNVKWIKDGKNGFIFETKKSEELALKIIFLLKNKDIRVKFGKINRKIIERKANYYEEMDKIEKHYINLIQRYKK